MISEMRTEMQELQVEVRTEVRELRTEVRTEVQKLHIDIRALENRLTSLEQRLARAEGLIEGLRDAIAAHGTQDAGRRNEAT